MTASQDHFDFVVVGVGLAGCVVAGRLSESGQHRMALLEAEGEDRSFGSTLPYLFRSERDQRVSVEGLRRARHIMSMAPMKPYIAAKVRPGPDKDNYQYLVDFFREHGHPNNHSARACKVGVDELTIVDPRLRVRGVEGLRVILEDTRGA